MKRCEVMRLRYLVVAPVLILLFAARLRAQEAVASPTPTPNETDSATPELIITGQELPPYRAIEATSATRLPAPIVDTDRSVQMITRQILEDRNIIDPQEAAQNVSGVQRG